jgi:LuxR family transcriptional regulator, maltose regulon positive regulatory protein
MMASPGESRRARRRVPPLALPRHRLVARVLASPPSSLCLIATPPGYGGTTLLGLVAAAATEPTVWVDVGDRDDKEPLRFWHRLLRGLEPAGVDVAEAVERLGTPGAGDVGNAVGDPAWPDEDAVAQALRVVSDAGPLLLLVDDLDTSRHGALAAQLLDFAEGQPSTCRLVVRTRRGSGLGLAHLVSSGRLVVLGAHDLSLDDAEARELVGLLAPRLPADRRDSVVTVCDGWVTALVAALRMVASDPEEDPTEWLLGGGLDPLFDDEVAHLGSEEAELLAATCVLDVLTPQACDALRGRGDSHLLLGRLDASQTMLTRKRAHGATFRLHPLFAGYLRRRLQLMGPTALADAHRRAAQWFLGHGDVERAIGHQLEAGDIAAAMSTLAQHLAPLLDAGKADLVRTWYSATGGPHVDQRHRHLLGAAWAEAIAGNVEGAEQQLHLVLDAVDHLSRESERQGDDSALATPVTDVLEESSREWLLTEASLLRGLLEGWRGYPARSRQSVERARRHYGDAWERMAHQSSAFLLVRTLLWSGRTPEAKELLTTAARRPQTKDYFRQLAIPALRALVAAQEGRSHRSLALARQAASALERVGPLGRFDGCDAALAEATAAVDLDQLDAADAAADSVAARGMEYGHVSYHLLGLLALVASRGARADLAGARLHLEEARLLLRTHAPGSDLAARVDLAEVCLSLELGELDRVRALAARLPECFEKEMALLRLERRHPPKLVQLRRLRAVTPRQMVDQRMLLAASSLVARPAEAEAHLLAAAETAYELGMHRALVGWPEELHVAAERVARQHASEAMTRLLWVARAPRLVPVQPMAALSTGDHRLLAALVTATSNADLADDLGISINTVKTRLRRLYAKLGVHGRDEAVRRARDAGLLR